MILAFVRLVMRIVYTRMTVAGAKGVKANVYMRRLAESEKYHHRATQFWPLGEQILTADVFDADAGTFWAMRAKYLSSPCGIELYQFSDHLMVPAGFEWHE